MTNAKSTKKALMLSILSLVLCFSMLIGTTFAWFTDSVTSANNIIKSGNLDIELEYWNGTAWVDVSGKSDILTNTLWEPGVTEVAYLRVKNAGSLALKYQLGINVVSETAGINAAGEEFLLSDYIQFGVVEGVNGATAAYATREEAVADVENAKIISTGYTKAESMASGDELYFALVVYMPTTVGNEANYKTGTNAPQINLGVNVFATQYTFEEDSFGNDYDEEAPWTGIVDTAWYNTTDTSFTITKAEQLAGLAEIVNSGKDTFKDKTITLAANVDLNNVNWTPIGNTSGEKNSTSFQGSFIGTDYTISNLRAVGAENVGLFGRTFTGAHIEGVTVVNAYVSGNDYVGVIVGGGYIARNCIKNCTVTNATVMATPYQKADGTYDGGAKAGVIAGQIYNGHVIGNTAKDSTVIAYRDLGGVVGMLAVDGSFTIEASGNTASNVTLNYVGVAGAYDSNTPNQNMAEIVGRVGKNAVVAEDNTATGVTQNEANKGVTAIYTYNELVAFANAVNGGNTYAGKTVILGADIDLMNAEWTPIGTSANPFKGTFDGNGKTVSNLVVTGYKSDVGFFGYTTDGEVKNLTIENATVSGRLDVAVVAGTPYTTKYTNITVKGHVEVNGMAYVGGVGGKNAYANWTDITVNVDETSYVKAISTENGTSYRTYVGGVTGFNGEGGHTFKNITTNINVIGDVCDIGGAFGIAHYGNNFENVTVTGNVTCLGEADEIGGIAGVWHNKDGYEVTMTNCTFKGTVSDVNGVVTGYDLTGGPYSATGTGKLIIDGNEAVFSVDQLQAALAAATEGTTTIVFGANLTGNVTVTQKANVKVVIDGNNMTYAGSITIDGKSATLESAGVKICNVNFDATAITKDACIRMGDGSTTATTNATRYVTNLTVENCTFTGTYPNAEKVGIKTYTGGGKNLVIENCTATKMHSLAQIHNIVNVTIEDCNIVDCKNGIGIGASRNAAITNCDMKVASYGVRGDANEVDSALTISNCKIDGAFIPVVIRKANTAGKSYTLTITGKNTITNVKNTEGVWCVAGGNEYGDVDKAGLTLVKATVTINCQDSALDANGIFVKQ